MPRTRADLSKRAFDVVMATCVLVLASPVMLAIAVLVRAQLGSPVIFRQQRPGLDGRPFTLYKFRTMLAATTGPDGELLTDRQRTPTWARRMRALSIDELPELWNVIRGDMSLVGPRPLLTEYLPRYTPWQARRHEVRPGITGLAQVRGRNAITWDDKFALDIEYVDHHDMRMDLDILWKTVGTVLSRDGVSHSHDTDMPFFMGTPDPSPGEDEGL